MSWCTSGVGLQVLLFIDKCSLYASNSVKEVSYIHIFILFQVRVLFRI